MINEIMEASDDLKSVVVSAWEVNAFFKENDVTIVALIPTNGHYILIVYTDREEEREIVVKGLTE